MAKTINHALDLMKKFESLYEDPENPEAILVVEDQEFPVHRIILATHSPIFKVLLYKNKPIDGETKKIPINAPLEAFKVILKYFYSGIVDLEGKNLEDFFEILELSRRYLMPELESSLIDTIIPMANKDNFHLLIVAAENLNSPKLRQKYCEILNENFVDFFESNSFLAMKENEVMKAFACESLRLSNAQKIEGLLKWISANPACDKAKVLESVVGLTKMGDLSKLITISSSRVKDAPEVIEQNLNLTPENEPAILIGSHPGNLSNFEIVNAYKKWGNSNEIVLDLGKFKEINCLKFSLGLEACNYKIYTSTLKTFNKENTMKDENWELCRSLNECSRSQIVYFSSVRTKFIRIEGAPLINKFQALYESKLPELRDYFLCPSYNIMTHENAYVEYKDSNNMLKWDYKENGHKPLFTSVHYAFTLKVTLNQPCYLSKCNLCVWSYSSKKPDNIVIKVMNSEGLILEVLVTDADQNNTGWYTFRFPQKLCSSFAFHQTNSNYQTSIVYFGASN